MKKQIKYVVFRVLLYFIVLNGILVSCKKEDTSIKEERASSSNSSNLTNASSYSADVIDKWMTIQIRLERNAVEETEPSFCIPGELRINTDDK